MWKCLTILLLFFPASWPSLAPVRDHHPQPNSAISCSPPSPTTILPDADGRYAPIMKPVVARLTDQDIVDLTAYIASLQP